MARITEYLQPVGWTEQHLHKFRMPDVRNFVNVVVLLVGTFNLARLAVLLSLKLLLTYVGGLSAGFATLYPLFSAAVLTGLPRANEGLLAWLTLHPKVA